MRIREHEELYKFIVEKFNQQIMPVLQYNYFNSILVTAKLDCVEIQPEIINDYNSIINAGGSFEISYMNPAFENEINYLMQNLIKMSNEQIYSR